MNKFPIPVAAMAAALFILAAPLTGQEAAKPAARSPLVPEIYASPIQAGCYIAAPGQCRIHADPFTIDIASGKKLVQFRLVAIQIGPGTQTIIYDWRPDQSNPAPALGTTYTPSLVTQDFGATCGRSYQISLQGQDTGDTGLFNLGQTGTFTCPSTVP